jgi:type II secretory pathway pseudopilin PulG
MKNMINKKWFTVVELVVAVMIVSILWVVGFIQFAWFLATSRDTNRISQVAEIYDGFVSLKMRATLPLPTNYIEVKKWDKLVSYQWHVGERILHQMEYTSNGMDPETGEFFTYALTRNKKSIAIMALLEEDPIIKNYVTQNEVFADEENEYKYPYIEWEKVGVIINNENTPIDRLEENKADWEFDLLSTWSDNYKMYLANDEIYTGTWSSIINIAKDYSCRRIKDLDPSTENGIFPLDTDWDGILTSTYCNMQIEWGGWTLAMKADWNETTFEYDSPYWENNSTYNPTDYKYDDTEFKWDHFSILPFNQVMLELKTGWATRYIIAAVTDSSLQNIFSNWYRPTYLTRDVWKTIIEDSSLQTECNKEGFNVSSTSYWHHVRFWILWNEQTDCTSPDSRLGIGGSGTACGTSSAPVWNQAWCSADNWDINITSFGYLYVR